jgi:hypothetical protein
MTKHTSKKETNIPPVVDWVYGFDFGWILFDFILCWPKLKLSYCYSTHDTRMYSYNPIKDEKMKYFLKKKKKNIIIIFISWSTNIKDHLMASTNRYKIPFCSAISIFGWYAWVLGARGTVLFLFLFCFLSENFVSFRVPDSEWNHSLWINLFVYRGPGRRWRG